MTGLTLRCTVDSSDRFEIDNHPDGDLEVIVRHGGESNLVFLSPADQNRLVEFITGRKPEPIKAADLIADVPVWQPVKAVEGAPKAFTLKAPGGYFYVIGEKTHWVDSLGQ